MSDLNDQRRLVCHLLLVIAEAEMQVENAKKRLTENPDFNSIEAFRRLTEDETIRLLDVRRFLKDNGYSPTDEEMEILYAALDRDHDRVISWGEFLNSCINREFSPDDSNFPNSWRVPREIPAEVERALAEVLMQELEAGLRIEDAKHQFISSVSKFALEQIFDQIDNEHKDYVSLVNLWTFIKSEAKETSLKVAERCFKRLDLDYDARINYDDWSESMEPYFKFSAGLPQAIPSNSFRSPRDIGSGDGLFTISSRLNTQSDFRQSGQKFGATYRSTADKTFSDSKYGKWRMSRSPDKRIITDTYNYIEDNAPVEKEVVTTITRKLPLEVRNSHDRANMMRSIPVRPGQEYRDTKMESLIFENYNIGDSHSKQGRDSGPRKDTQEGSEYNLQEKSPAKPLGITNRSVKPGYGIDEIIEEDPGEEDNMSPPQSRTNAPSDIRIGDEMIPRNIGSVDSIDLSKSEFMPPNELSPKKTQNLLKDQPKNQPAKASNPLMNNPAMKNFQKGLMQATEEARGGKAHEYTDTVFEKKGIHTQRTIMETSVIVGAKRYIRKKDQNSVREHSVEEVSYSGMSIRDKQAQLRALRAKNSESGGKSKKGGLGSSSLLRKAQELKAARDGLNQKSKEEGLGGNDSRDLFTVRTLTDIPRKEVPDEFERYLYSDLIGNYEQTCKDAAEREHSDQMPWHIQQSASPYDIGKQNYSKPGKKIESNLSWAERQKLIQYLIDFIRDFRIVEQKRMNLAMRFDFTLPEFFVMADDSKGNCISPHDFVKVLKRLEVDLTFEDAMLLFSAYDFDRDRYLNYEEYSSVFTPFNREFREALTTRSKRKIFELSHYNSNTKKAIKDCMACVFNAEQKFIHYKEELKGRLHELFDLMDVRGTGKVTIRDLQGLFSEQRFHASEIEVAALMHRFDGDQDGIITGSEFSQAMRSDVGEYEQDYLSRRGMKPSKLWLNGTVETTTRTVTTSRRHSHHCCCPCTCGLTLCGCYCNTSPCESIVDRRTVTEKKKDIVPYRSTFGELCSTASD